VWLGEAFWWWRHPDWLTRRSAGVTWALRVFYFVIVASATVVFTTGARRAGGTFLVAALIALWVFPARLSSTATVAASGHDLRQ
jgi:hypothetical protein